MQITNARSACSAVNAVSRASTTVIRSGVTDIPTGFLADVTTDPQIDSINVVLRRHWTIECAGFISRVVIPTKRTPDESEVSIYRKGNTIGIGCHQHTASVPSTRATFSLATLLLTATWVMGRVQPVEVCSTTSLNSSSVPAPIWATHSTATICPKVRSRLGLMQELCHHHRINLFTMRHLNYQTL